MGFTGIRGRKGVLRPTTPGHAVAVQQWHLPDHEAAPVVTHEHGPLDVERVEQADQVAGQVEDVVVDDGLGPGAAAVAALVGGDGPEPGGGDGRQLVAASRRPGRGSRGRRPPPGRDGSVAPVGARLVHRQGDVVQLDQPLDVAPGIW